MDPVKGGSGAEGEGILPGCSILPFHQASTPASGVETRMAAPSGALVAAWTSLCKACPAGVRAGRRDALAGVGSLARKTAFAQLQVINRVPQSASQKPALGRYSHFASGNIFSRGFTQ
jgi:hypothetical protein